eukprot:jgi/Tetstr1/431333/TSEL_021024.t1
MGRIVPWLSWVEWEQTATALLSWDPCRVRGGIDRVASWRCRGRVPLGADITASLMELVLQDAAWPHGLHTQVAPGLNPTAEMSLRLAYAMTLVRFVNGVVDSGQKGQSACSVSMLADSFGMPRLLVDMRHEATHNKLPSLSMLRLAVQHALSWLEYNYWDGQRRHLESNISRIETILHDYHELFRIRRTASREQLAEGSAAGGSPAPGTFKQQRKRVLTELKDSVPAPAAELLARPLLKVMLRPTGKTGPDAEPASMLRAEEFEALSREWQHLPTLVLDAVVQDACQAMHARDWPAAQTHAQLATELLGLISGSMASKRRSSGRPLQTVSGGESSETRPADWLDSRGLGAQLVQLLKAFSAALPAQADAGAPQADRPGAEVRSTWKQLVQAFAALAEPRSLGQRAMAMLKMTSAADGSGQPSASPGAEALGALEAARKRQAELLRKKDGNSTQEAGTWEVAQGWIPCAVGCLPSRSAPNGVIPRLVAHPARPAAAPGLLLPELPGSQGTSPDGPGRPCGA